MAKFQKEEDGKEGEGKEDKEEVIFYLDNNGACQLQVWREEGARLLSLLTFVC